MPLFVISFLFGQTLELSIFAEICRFLIIAIFQVSPLCHLFWVFAKPLINSCPIPHFLNLPISWNRQLSILLVCTWRHDGHFGGREQKHLSPLGTKLYFHVNYSRKIILYWFSTPRMPLLWSHLKFLLDHWWIQIRQFRKICHFRKTHNYRHASFVILF